MNNISKLKSRGETCRSQMTRPPFARAKLRSGTRDSSMARNDRVGEAVEILKNGGVVVFPTETAYGLAVDATNEKAVRRVFVIKERGEEETFPLIAADLKMVEKYTILSPVMKRLVKKYWPGPLTVVASVRQVVGNKNFCSLRPGVIRSGTIAIRVPDHDIARDLSHKLGRPIISTSANLSGQPTCYSVRAVKKQLAGRKFQPDFYLDVGGLTHRRLSTIVEEKDGKIIVLRQGRIKI